MEKFGKFMLGLMLYAVATFVFGIVLMFMWNWFVVPLGVVKIGFWLALGLSLTIKCFFGSKSNDSDDGFIMDCAVNIFVYLIVWGIGAIVQLFL